MIEITSSENIIEILIKGFKYYIQLLFNKTIWLLSFLFGIVLTAIGYPKDIVVFIVMLVIIDTITKQCAIIKKHYGKINFKNFLKACITNKISSKLMKTGLGVKVSFYLIFLYIAHQIRFMPEIIGNVLISNTFYSLLVIIETKSISENFLLCGYKKIKPLLNFLNIKEEEIINRK